VSAAHLPARPRPWQRRGLHHMPEHACRWIWLPAWTNAVGEPKGTLAPHRGFETVTYMLDGILRHQDSNGGGGLVTDGDTSG
jgi:redox-sensitive bicupin YhaK (pirin superfamily)